MLLLALAVLGLDSGLSHPQLISLVLISHQLGWWRFLSSLFLNTFCQLTFSFLHPSCPCQLNTLFYSSRPCFIHSVALFCLISLPVSFSMPLLCHLNANVTARTCQTLTHLPYRRGMGCFSQHFTGDRTSQSCMRIALQKFADSWAVMLEYKSN